MRRIVSLWLPHWPTEIARPSAKRSEPLALVVETAGTARLAAACPVAQELGLGPGMTLSDARALVPALAVRPADPPAAARALDRLADWAMRFSPWVAIDGADGLWLDVTGCGHLFGGEDILRDRLCAGIEARGFTARAALADTPGGAWALARFGAGGVNPPGTLREALADLPVAALRLEAATVAALDRVGLRRIGDLLPLPRAPLAARFGTALIRRLDQALGRIAEPISPRQPLAPYLVRRAFAEPVADTTSLQAALDGLLDCLCESLAKDQRGARRLILSLYRIDGDVQTVTVGTGRPRHDPAALARLFADKFDGLDVGPGIEVMTLTAAVIDHQPPVQRDLNRRDDDPQKLGALVDRLANRPGSVRLLGFRPRASHLPERAVRRGPPAPDPLADHWPLPGPRPIRLLAPPQPIDAMAMVPDAPPLLFRWRGRAHKVAHAAGPERIEGEWWHENAPARDYYRVEDEDGARFWLFRAGLYRDGADPRWYLHGLFA